MLAVCSTAALSLLLYQRPPIVDARRHDAVRATLSESEAVVEGEVLWFNDAKGFGFLKIDDEADDQVSTHTQHFHANRHAEQMRKWARGLRDGTRILVRCPTSVDAEGAWLVNWPEMMNTAQKVEHEASRGLIARPPSARESGPLDKYFSPRDPN